MDLMNVDIIYTYCQHWRDRHIKFDWPKYYKDFEITAYISEKKQEFKIKGEF